MRKLICEIFLRTRRKKTTADELNKLGYRTRKGALFSDTTVTRLLRDTTAKGERPTIPKSEKRESVLYLSKKVNGS
ncbi:recombinase family protein [Sphingobacterium sp. UBA6645]|uniref:recombinase family protein n=1 Tax=Sphingobacterium sp. UBA6645 TaxID=1947511 RepID=UPI0025FF87FF|nr:recombinase family protein [Sphingobacterium sp. UBA6645]